jgi:hypothetical protein
VTVGEAAVRQGGEPFALTAHGAYVAHAVDEKGLRNLKTAVRGTIG